MQSNRSYKELVSINNAVDESVNSLIREQSEKDLRKEIIERMKEEFEFTKEEIKLFKISVTERYKEDCTEKLQELEEGLSYNDNLLEAESKWKSVSKPDDEE